MILKIKGNKMWFSAVSMLIIVAVIATIARIASPKTNYTFTKNKNPYTVTPAVNTVTIENMRGVWVPYMSLDTGEYTEASFKENFNKIVETA